LLSGLVNTTQQVGGALGLAVLATLSTSHTNALQSHGASIASALTGGYRVAFTVAAALVIASIPLALLTLRPGSIEPLGDASGELAYIDEAA